jgi:hypothetical protein
MTRPSGNWVPVAATIMFFFCIGSCFCTGPARKFAYKYTFSDFRLSPVINASVLRLLDCVDVGYVTSVLEEYAASVFIVKLCVVSFWDFVYIYIYDGILVKCTLNYVRNFCIIYWFSKMWSSWYQLYNSRRCDTVLPSDCKFDSEHLP